MDSRLRGNDGFTESAAKLAGLTGALFGWLPHEFWMATPAELAAILSAATGDAPPGVPLAKGDLARMMEQCPDG